MDIVSALFVENINLRQVPGPSTRIDLSGVMFSLPAPEPPPVTIGPHLVVLIRCRENEPGKFTYRLVRGELTYQSYGTIEAHCRVDRGDWTVVPLTLLPPV